MVAFRHAPPLVLAVLLSTVGAARAHGLAAQPEDVPVRAFRFVYSSGEPLAFGEVQVWSPQTAGVEFQNGRTDAEGRFAFVPNAPGEWRIQARDGQGHVAKATAATGSPPLPAATARPPQWPMAALGVSVILNVFLALQRLCRG